MNPKIGLFTIHHTPPNRNPKVNVNVNRGR